MVARAGNFARFFPPGHRLKLGEGMVGWTGLHGISLVANDVSAESRYVNLYPEVITTRSELSVPIHAGSEVIGVLDIQCPRAQAFDENDVMAMETLTDLLATAFENARLFQETCAGRKRLQILSQRLVEVQEAERRHIARELHDEIGQALAGLKLLLEIGARVPTAAARNNVDEALMEISRLIAQVRDLSLGLRPAMLDDLGILPAILWYCEHYHAKTGVVVAFKHTGLEGKRFLPELETAVYRIVQEALTNVARHAGVRKVSIHLWSSEDFFFLQIDDRGIGFDSDAALARADSYGLIGMYERATILGGQLAIKSVPGAGTRITARLPLRIDSLIDKIGNNLDYNPVG